MSWAQDTKLRFQFFFIALVVLCPGFLIWMYPSARRQIDSNSWPQVQGVVVGTIIKSEGRNDSLVYFGRVQYHYKVDGQDYTSDLTDLGPGSKHKDEAEAKSDVATFRTGDPVTVYFDPKDPGVGVLKKGISENHFILLIALSAGTLIGVIASVFTIRSWRRAWAVRKSAQAVNT